MEKSPELKLPLRTRVRRFFGKHIVLWVALTAAAVTCFFVPPDSAYKDYFDWRTLSCLFCTLAVVCAFREIHFFELLSRSVLRRFVTTRSVVLTLVMITYFGSMVLANDMALITFLPLGFFTLQACEKQKLMAFTFVMQNVAANLGGMLTPFGNPQNLYLYSYYSIPTGEFFRIMAIPFCVALVLIVGTCMFVRKEPVAVTTPLPYRYNVPKTVLYGAMFILSVCMVMRLFPYYWGLLAVTVLMLIFAPKALLRVDYPLLLTFCAFFVFSGNLSRIPAIQQWLSSWMQAAPLAVALGSCQIISNVPSAVLLSHFTDQYASLLVAVNIGGLGTPIASLASLITLTEYRNLHPGDTKRYMRYFLGINFGFLAVLAAVQLMIEYL